ncbi:MAG: hypothetical protein ACRCW1_11175 [Anaerotignaceae bacterium]
MENEENLNVDNEEYKRVEMFEEFDDNGEFPPSMNDLFGVIS